MKVILIGSNKNILFLMQRVLVNLDVTLMSYEKALKQKTPPEYILFDPNYMNGTAPKAMEVMKSKFPLTPVLLADTQSSYDSLGEYETRLRQYKEECYKLVNEKIQTTIKRVALCNQTSRKALELCTNESGTRQTIR